MKSARLGLGLVVLSSCLAFVACGDDDDGGSGGHAGEATAGAGGAGQSLGTSECQVIGELCHEADTGSGPGHDCHELGHEADPAACVEGFASCIDTCVEDEGAGGGAATERDPYCAALGELCHVVDDENGPLHDCHELGHEGDGAACLAGFEDCASKCLAARELLEEGAGGAGGAAAGGAASGGAASGGATGGSGAPAGGAGGAG